ncbi:hypothetical protein HanRHA438_Chr16g0741461 [Helianthus annuus]|nr:hypothetical protein HanRHA438_Chr16g0741461 [Helianthus annuus]
MFLPILGRSFLKTNLEEGVCSCLRKGLLKYLIPDNGIFSIFLDGTFPERSSMESICSCSCKRRDFLVDGRDFRNALVFRREYRFVQGDQGFLNTKDCRRTSLSP